VNASVGTNQSEFVIESGASLVSEEIVIATLRPYSKGSGSTSTPYQRQLVAEALSYIQRNALETGPTSTRACSRPRSNLLYITRAPRTRAK
jgi:hypothetical protein